jgi:hypothetical protein
MAVELGDLPLSLMMIASSISGMRPVPGIKLASVMNCSDRQLCAEDRRSALRLARRARTRHRGARHSVA